MEKMARGGGALQAGLGNLRELDPKRSTDFLCNTEYYFHSSSTLSWAAC
jgi:hypothetical protein